MPRWQRSERAEPSQAPQSDDDGFWDELPPQSAPKPAPAKPAPAEPWLERRRAPPKPQAVTLDGFFEPALVVAPAKPREIPPEPSGYKLSQSDLEQWDAEHRQQQRSCK
ncbi:unnamed protein product, partial [Effrenium voratum]